MIKELIKSLDLHDPLCSKVRFKGQEERGTAVLQVRGRNRKVALFLKFCHGFAVCPLCLVLNRREMNVLFAGSKQVVLCRFMSSYVLKFPHNY
jgi:hypothetical protein